MEPSNRLPLAIVSLFLVLASFAEVSGNHLETTNPTIYTRDFAVELEDDGDEMIADLVARTHGFRVVKRLVDLGNVYFFEHEDIPQRSKRSADDYVGALLSDPNVRTVEQQKLLVRKKRELFSDGGLVDEPEDELKKRILETLRKYEENLDHDDKRDEDLGSDGAVDEVSDDAGGLRYNDPSYPDQSYLQQEGRKRRSLTGLDLNLGVVWDQGITGKGVVVSVLDDGLQYSHPDLMKNYDPKASTDLNSSDEKDNDPTPNVNISGNDHGTKCAGEIAAEANNGVCGVGVAYNCKIGGIRMLDGRVTDLLEGEALSFGIGHVDVYSASWGPTDNGRKMEGPGKYCQMALDAGISKGRNGLGSIYVWATGNGGMNYDNCNCDGYVSSIYTVSIGSVTDYGLSTYYSEVCASTLAVVYTGGPHSTTTIRKYKASPHAVVTVDINGGCTNQFVGTSGAAPLGAGCVALVLEANPKLTWRDVQYIIIDSARIPNRQELVWTINGAGKHVSHQFGFGLMDCGRMVELAQNWTNVGPQHTCQVADRNVTRVIPTKGTVNVTLLTDGCSGDSNNVVDTLEHVEAIVKLSHSYRGDVKLVLVSPAGTRSIILQYRPNDDDDDGINFKFMSVHFWGEDPRGTWTLTVSDNPKPSSRFKRNQGKISYFSLLLYGTSESVSKDGKVDMKKRDTVAHKANSEDIDNIMVKEKRMTNGVRIKRIVDSIDEENDAVEDVGLVKSVVSVDGHSIRKSDDDIVSKILRTIGDRTFRQKDKKGLDPEEDEFVSPQKKEVKSLVGHVGARTVESDQTSGSDGRGEAIQAKRAQLIEALHMNGYSRQDLVRAIDSLQVKIKTRIAQLSKSEDTSQMKETSSAPSSSELSSHVGSANSVVDGSKTGLNENVNHDITSAVVLSSGHSSVKHVVDSSKSDSKENVNHGVDPSSVESAGNIADGVESTYKKLDVDDNSGVATTDGDKSDVDVDKNSGAATAGPSHDNLKDNLIRELRKKLEEWHKSVKQ